MSDQDPYRDERESLRAEVERLRARARRPRRWPGLVLGGLCLHVIARLLLGDWLNGGDDTRFWLAVGVSVAPLVGSLGVLVLVAKRG